MSKKCLKCGYIRDNEADKLTPDYECPACGVVYAKVVLKGPEAEKKEEVSVEKEAEAIEKEKPESGVNEKQNKKQKEYGLGCFSIIIFLIFLYILGSSLPDNDSDHADFYRAIDGEYWVINDSDIALMTIPEIPPNEHEFKKKVIVLLDPSTKVEIIRSKDSSWKEVFMINQRGQRALRGWILTATVKSARKVE